LIAKDLESKVVKNKELAELAAGLVELRPPRIDFARILCSENTNAAGISRRA
jgi:hypothetical protein